MEIDNIAYSIVVGERLRTKFETAGYVRLADSQADALSNTKIAHVALLAPSVPVAVLVAYLVGFDLPARLPMLAFLLADRMCYVLAHSDMPTAY